MEGGDLAKFLASDSDKPLSLSLLLQIAIDITKVRTNLSEGKLYSQLQIRECTFCTLWILQFFTVI